MLAGHGEPGVISLGRGRRCPARVTLDWLESELADDAHNAIVFVGSCAALEVHGRILRRFLNRTGARAIMGYGAEVEYVPAASFELLALSRIIRAGADRRGVQRLAGSLDRLARSAPFKRLEFRAVYR